MKVKELGSAAWSKVPVTLRLPVAVIGIAVLIIFIVFYGAKVKNKISSALFHREVTAAKSEIQEARTDINQGNTEIEKYKAIAADALGKLAASKEETEREKEGRLLAEKLLADKSKNTDQKLRAYKDAMSRTPVTHVDESDDELCARAKQAGITTVLCQ